MDIQFYTNEQINKAEWDDHINHSSANLIYARSVYLDHMCEGWCALMDSESQSVMPLPVKKKFGVTYAFQPPFVQQLGVFSKKELDAETIRAFLNRASEICSSVSLYLNYTNRVDFVRERCNFILDLNRPFDQIKENFRKDLIDKALRRPLRYAESVPDEMFGMYREYVLPKNKTLSVFHLNQFQELVSVFFSSGHALVRKMISAEGETLSVALFLKDKNRIYYMMSATTQDGRASDANALLLYETIREFAGMGLLFDFEGSEIPGVKFFFEKFGPVNQPYFHFESDRMNPLLKAVKRIADLIRF